MRSLLLASVVALAGLAQAQNCGTLAVASSSTSVTISLTGSTANAFAFAVIGDTEGSTPITFGTTTITLGLASPFIPVPLNRTDANGDASLVIPIRAALPQQMNLFAQGLTLSLSLRPFGLTGCVSNVVPFTVG